MEFLSKILHIILALLMMFFGVDEDVAYEINSSAASAPMAVYFVDVGQGDCIYIRLPDGKNMLIDAGENEDGTAVVEYLKELGVNKIDYAVGTHPHADHIGGLDDVLNSIETDVLYMPSVPTSTATFVSVLDAVEENGVKLKKAEKNVIIENNDEYEIKILSPVSKKYDEMNNYSAVVHISYGDTAFLFMGDAEKLAERQIIESGAMVEADVLKVGHHGSETSTDFDFLTAVSPEVAVISCGEGNSYGHPHTDVTDKLKDERIHILRTDKHGNIVIGSDGKNIVY